MKKGIIFDMDGTLWDSAENVAESWNVATKKAGYERKNLTKEDMYRVMGKTMDEIADILYSDFDSNDREKLLKLCCTEENDYLRAHGGNLYPDIENVLEILKKKYNLYIVSNCQSGYIEAFLDYYKLGYLFDDIECFGNNGKEKAFNIELVVKRNELTDAVYVGDIQGDYDSSMKAGVKFIHAAYGFGEINADVPKIVKFEDLLKIIERVL